MYTALVPPDSRGNIDTNFKYLRYMGFLVEYPDIKSIYMVKTATAKIGKTS